MKRGCIFGPDAVVRTSSDARKRDYQLAKEGCKRWRSATNTSIAWQSVLSENSSWEACLQASVQPQYTSVQPQYTAHNPCIQQAEQEALHVHQDYARQQAGSNSSSSSNNGRSSRNRPRRLQQPVHHEPATIADDPRTPDHATAARCARAIHADGNIRREEADNSDREPQDRAPLRPYSTGSELRRCTGAGVDEENEKLASVFAGHTGGGVDTFGNVGQLRLVVQKTGVAAQSAGPGAADKTTPSSNESGAENICT
ncbi:hypothetical protein LXA43DRAFT_1066859 [Ganoderma leucocontextum]|nr:hypothetical protein LXA43DRAFT_1066859 [Ganoderma leucocontextum]